MQKQVFYVSITSVIPVIILSIIFSFITIGIQSQTVCDLIRNRTIEGKDLNAIIVDGVKMMDQEFMPLFNQEREFEPVWSNSVNRIDIIMIQKRSNNEGLLLQYYHVRKIIAIMQQIE